MYFFNKTFTVIWYLKPFVSFERLLNKSLILDLLASNRTIEYFLSIIWTLYDIACPLNARSGKTNALLNLVNEQYNIDRISLYAKDISEPKYGYLIKKRKDVGIKHLNDPNAYIEWFNLIDDVYEKINDYNPRRKGEKIIVFDDMNADMMTNKKFKATIKELFIRMQNIKYVTCFFTQYYFYFPK